MKGPSSSLARRSSSSTSSSMTPTSSRKLGDMTLGLARSTNAKTVDKLVWAARTSAGVPVLVHIMKPLSYNDWANARWTVVRKGTEGTYPQSPKTVWQPLDRKRLLLVGSHHAVFEVVLAEPSINEETNAFFPIRLKCEVGGIEVMSKPFFVLGVDAVGSLSKMSLQKLDEWFLDPNMGLSSVVQQSVIKQKSLGAAFLKRHTTALTLEEEASRSRNAPHSVFIADDEAQGVRAKFLGQGLGNPVVRAIEKLYPVPVPMDDAHLLIAVSQVFHFTHEAIHWVGDQASTELLFAYNSSMLPNVYAEFGKDKLHVYGSIIPLKGMYQHSNPRLKIPFDTLCMTLKVILAANGLPKRWVENDGPVGDMTEAQIRARQFYTYEAVFGGEDGKKVFNVNTALDALSKSITVNRHGALVIDYSIIIPVLVNTLDELNGFFVNLTKSKLRHMIGNCLEQLFSAQAVVSEIAVEIAAMQDERAANEQAQIMDGGLVVKHLSALLKDRYTKMPLHLTQATDFECFIAPSFDLFESAADRERSSSEAVLAFSELVQSDLTVCRLAIRGHSGSGKTTLCRYLAREWAAGRSIFSGKFDVVIFLPLACVTTTAYEDLAQVTIADVVQREIVDSSPELRSLLADKDEVSAWLVANSHRILWLLDGLDALEEFVDNVYNVKTVATPSAAAAATAAAAGAAPSGTPVTPKTPATPQPRNAVHNVKDLLRSLEHGSTLDTILKNRIVTSELGCSTALVADLYLVIRPFDNHAVREYLGKFFPPTDESGTDQEISADMEQGYGSDMGVGASKVASPSSNKQLSTKAQRIWMALEKNKMLSRDMVHLPMHLELVCQSYLSEPEFHLLPEHTLADLFSRFYTWLLAGTTAGLDKFVQKVAYSTMFKAKYAAPTIMPKVFNQVPREFRVSVASTRFFEPASFAGKGVRFIHPRLAQYLTARYLTDPSEDRFTMEVFSRLKSKVISRQYHNVFYFLVGMVRNDRTRLNKVFDLVLLDERELGLLGARGPSFVFRCFEETSFDRGIRTRVIEWFWKHFGKPDMQIWRSNFVINLLELMIFKLTRRPAGSATTATQGKESDSEAAAPSSGPDQNKATALRALGRLGLESNRVVQLLVRAGQQFPDLLPDVILAVQQIATTSLSVIPLLFEALKSRVPKDLMVAITEVRRMIVPAAIEKSSGGSKTVDAAAGKLVKIGMDWIDSSEEAGRTLVFEVLVTLDQWNWGDDRVLPLLVNALEHRDMSVRRAAVSAVRWVDLSGPNVYYNDKIVGCLEYIGKKESRLRAEVLDTFLTLSMDTDHVRELLLQSLAQTDDLVLQQRVVMLCGQHHVRHRPVVEAISKIALLADNQDMRRGAIDVLAYIFLPDFKEDKSKVPSAEEIQGHINQVVDTLYTFGLSSEFVTHRVVRMADKKSKSAHIGFTAFASKYM